MSAPPASNPAAAGLLLIVGEPFSEDYRDLIVAEITKGFKSWDCESCDINEALAKVAKANPTGEENNGERSISNSSESLQTEILINATKGSVQTTLLSMLSSPISYKYIVYAGHAFDGTGDWILQDDVFSFEEMCHIMKKASSDGNLQSSQIILQIPGKGFWSQASFGKHIKDINILVNPEGVVQEIAGVMQFSAFVSAFVKFQPLPEILQSSDIVGNIRFSKPTLYVFPGGHGDSALFGISGFNLLVNGGYSRKACFWDFARHLDRIDAVLLTHLSFDNVFGIGSVLKRKLAANVHPEVGHIYYNSLDKVKSSNGDDVGGKGSLIVNLVKEGNTMIENLTALGQPPNNCTRPNSNNLEPVNLYHKVGHGSLDCYILNPIADSKEVKEFLAHWQKEAANITASKGVGQLPLPDIISVCALLVWKSSDRSQKPTRILFPGNAPQQKVFEGLDKLKSLDCLKNGSVKKPATSATKSGRPTSAKAGAGDKKTTAPAATKTVPAKKDASAPPKKSSSNNSESASKKESPKNKSASPDPTKEKEVSTAAPPKAEPAKAEANNPPDVVKVNPVSDATGKPTEATSAKVETTKEVAKPVVEDSPQKLMSPIEPSKDESLIDVAPHVETVKESTEPKNLPEEKQVDIVPQEPSVKEVEQNIENHINGETEEKSIPDQTPLETPQALPDPCLIEQSSPVAANEKIDAVKPESEVQPISLGREPCIDSQPERIVHDEVEETQKMIPGPDSPKASPESDIKEESPEPEFNVESFPIEESSEVDDEVKEAPKIIPEPDSLEGSPEPEAREESPKPEISEKDTESLTVNEESTKVDVKEVNNEEEKADVKKEDTLNVESISVIQDSTKVDVEEVNNEEEKVDVKKDESDYPVLVEGDEVIPMDRHLPKESTEEVAPTPGHPEIVLEPDHLEISKGLEDNEEKLEDVQNGNVATPEDEMNANVIGEASDSRESSIPSSVSVDTQREATGLDSREISPFDIAEKDDLEKVSIVEPKADSDDLISVAEKDDLEKVCVAEPKVDDLISVENESTIKKDNLANEALLDPIPVASDLPPNNEKNDHTRLVDLDLGTKNEHDGNPDKPLEDDLSNDSASNEPETADLLSPCQLPEPVEEKKNISTPAEHPELEGLDGFDPLKHWDEPMGLPSPPPVENGANGGPATDKPSSKKPSTVPAKKKDATPASSTKKASPAPADKKKTAAPAAKSGTQSPRASSARSTSATKPERVSSARTSKANGPVKDDAKAERRPSSGTVTKKSVTATSGRVGPAETKALAKSASAKTRPSSSTTVASKPSKPVATGPSYYVDLAYVPHHGDPLYCDVKFFFCVRARYYVISSLSPSAHVLNALLEAKEAWDQKESEVTIIPTYDNDSLRHWMGLHKDKLDELKIDVAPSANRCTIQLQDHETSCAAYRLEF